MFSDEKELQKNGKEEKDKQMDGLVFDADGIAEIDMRFHVKDDIFVDKVYVLQCEIENFDDIVTFGRFENMSKYPVFVNRDLTDYNGAKYPLGTYIYNRKSKEWCIYYGL